MKVILDDGMTIDCGGYKALDSGIVLTEDKKRKHVIGFVPHDEVRFILPDDVLAEREHDDGTTEFVYVPDDERQRRIEELETEVARLEADVANDEATIADLEAQMAEIEAERAAETEPEDLTVIDGIGPKYAERLEAAGITTFRALREAAVEDVVEATGVSDERAERWITATKRGETSSEGDEEAAAEGGKAESEESTDSTESTDAAKSTESASAEATD
ncbi:Helix-hairpin-helix domain-containing protein [Halogranum rubrum]|uniref:Helix-hairpin-helix domain-containing protein n=1 Tax=Halogranum rubrum TaxID=553466 RepID=A0A1I4G3S7_9EURY|nr:helix-hairpin-helix domain-containing protein [Halogranum rubrum]SFL23711.1 Helix-hairpin-helix domain-containing protein [Halogranum rubrum]